MKKSLLALAVLGTTGGLAHADEVIPGVTIYGNIDASVMSQSQASPSAGGPNKGKTTTFVDGQMENTFFGIKGNRDLGDGLKGGFTLEEGFSLGNGQHNNPGAPDNGTSVFSLEANVYLSGSWGKATFGQQFDPAFIASIGTEPRGMTNSFSSLNQWIGAVVGNGAAAANTPMGLRSGMLTGGLIDTNSVGYSYHNNGLYIGMQYGFGGVAGSNTANSTQSIGAAYTVSGFTVSGGYATANADPATGASPGKSSEITNYGVGYANGPFAVRAQYGEYKSNLLDGGLTPASGGFFDDVKTWGVGFDYATSNKNKLNLSYYDSKDTGGAFGGHSKLFALMDKYEIFKMTHVYAQIASTKVDTNSLGQSTAGLSADIGGVYNATGQLLANPGNTTYIGAGITYAF